MTQISMYLQQLQYVQPCATSEKPQSSSAAVWTAEESTEAIFARSGCSPLSRNLSPKLEYNIQYERIRISFEAPNIWNNNAYELIRRSPT